MPTSIFALFQCLFILNESLDALASQWRNISEKDVVSSEFWDPHKKKMWKCPLCLFMSISFIDIYISEKRNIGKQGQKEGSYMLRESMWEALKNPSALENSGLIGSTRIVKLKTTVRWKCARLLALTSVKDRHIIQPTARSTVAVICTQNQQNLLQRPWSKKIKTFLEGLCVLKVSGASLTCCTSE